METAQTFQQTQTTQLNYNDRFNIPSNVNPNVENVQ